MMLHSLKGIIKGGETYLITGANGFVGSSIVYALLEFNYYAKENPCRIIIVVRNRDKAIKKFGGIVEDKNITLIVNENKERILVSERVDWIICAAAVTKKEIIKKYPADTLNSNIFGIYNCLELAKEKKVKGILFISSVQAYGRVQNDMIREDDFGNLDCMKEEAVYPESKRVGEMLIWAYNKQFGVPAMCARLFHVYGEGEEYDNGTFLSDFVNDVINDRDIVIKGSGSEVRNLCYISDVVRGIFFILHKGKHGEAYNVGSESNNYTIKECAQMLQVAAKEVGHEVTMVIKNEKYENGKVINVQIPCVEKLKLLGWKEEDVDVTLNFKKLLKEAYDRVS